ncbi:hypothetical protein P872_23995 [Rhodonellum psychrophilum GCM71 = DSM 17998]|uniref:GyrI-like small molecule binding domain-containing protein n=2 Tax=Rhodonellum TaxID=336827 RepID=U5C4M5_9BACT|nr:MULTISPECIES: hypothetical protein [Rhodonellum]ERM84774.1 hypothetical protein P872_23995 [Rhodonellum psychrophilum GCM71 = DSM 17998]SDZ11591.1 hypothetical protein SAMN05444412_10638 [Rhodonellum ikkaensis]
MKKWIIGGFLLFLIALGFYQFDRMGGFNEIVIDIQEIEAIDLTGIYFKGVPEDEAIGLAFQTMGDLQSKASGSTLHTIYFVEPAGKRDTMEVFVGLEDRFILESEGFSKQSFPAGTSVVAHIEANRFVMPSPNKIKQKMEAFALENGLNKPKVFIDMLLGPDEVRVVAPIVK